MIERRKMNRGQGGFTLIELLVVIGILAVLGGVAVFAVNGLTDDASAAACKTEYDTVRTAASASDASASGDSWDTYIEGGVDAVEYWEFKLDENDPPVGSVTPTADYSDSDLEADDRDSCDLLASE